MNAGFKEQIKRQCKVVFGGGRYWFHLLIWASVALYILSNNSFNDFNRGMQAGSSGDTTEISIELSKTTTPNGNINYTMVVLSTLIGALLVYLFLLLVIPLARHKRKRRVLWIGLASIGLLWLTALLGMAFILGYKAGHADKLDKEDALITLIASLIFAMVTSALFFSLYYFIDLYDQLKYQKQYEKMLADKIDAETNFLKTQINPHFLFNTLNNIYSLTLSKSEHAATITSQLQQLIKYMLEDCNKIMVPLQGEINFLKNYISLERLRNKQENVTIVLETEGEYNDKHIAPLLLINFIENAFKHGVKAGVEASFVHINISIQHNILSFEIINSIPLDTATNTQQDIKESGGIGIANVERRLAILYPNKHKLKINNETNRYNVHLTLEL